MHTNIFAKKYHISFDDINEDSQKSFFEQYINNNQLTPEGITLKQRLIPKISNYIQQNFMKSLIPTYEKNYVRDKLYTFLLNSIKKIKDSFFIDEINIDQFNNLELEEGLNQFIDIIFPEIFNTIEKNLKKMFMKETNKKSFISLVLRNNELTLAGEKFKETLLKYLISWYKSNNKQVENIKEYLLNYWTEEQLYTITDSLNIDPKKYNRWFRTDLKQITDYCINHLSNSELNKFAIIKTNVSLGELEKKVIRAIKKNLYVILDLVTFPRKENGSYEFSWLGFSEKRNDALPVFLFLANNKDYANIILQYVHLTVDEIESLTNLDWKKFLFDAYQYNYDEILQLKVRSHIVELNKAINDERSSNLENLADNNLIGIKDTTKINYNPRFDTQRSVPFIAGKDIYNNKYFVLIGEDGTNHGLLSKKNDELLSKTRNNNGTEYVAFGYGVGNIAFLDLKMHNGFSSLQELLNVITEYSHFKKVYTIPKFNRGGFITRLARRLKMFN